MGESLKPCPFCGWRATLARIISHEGEARGDTPSWDIDCTGCGLWRRFASEAEAVERWNMRPTQAEESAVYPPQDIATVRDWLRELPSLDMEDIAADGGVTVAMVVQQQAREMAPRMERALREISAKAAGEQE